MKLKYAARTILIVLAAAFCIAVFSACNDNESQKGLTLKANGKTVFLSEEKSVFFYDYTASGRTKFTIINNTEVDETVVLYAEEGQTLDFYCEAGSKEDYTVEIEGFISGGISLGENAYVATPEALLAATSEGKAVTLIDNINTEELILRAPVTIFCDNYSLSLKRLGFEYGYAGIFSISGNVSCEEIYAEAPLSQISVPASIAPDMPELYLNCLIFNNESLKGKSVDSEEKFLKTAEIGSEKPTVVVENFDLTKDVTFSHPVKLVTRNLGGEGKIIIKTEKSGEISVTGFDPDRLVIDAPNCALTCEGTDVLTAARLWNTESYNGYNTAEIRNSGEYSGSLTASLGKYKWTLRGGELKSKISGMILPRTMESVKLSVNAPGCTVEYCDFCKNEDGTLNLLSRNGVALRIKQGDETAIVPVETSFENILPVVEITTSDKKGIESKTEWKTASFSFDASFAGKDWDIIDNVECEIAGRGNSTWDWSFKKPYKIKLQKKESVAGLTASKNWVLLANYLDKSLIRNYVALECAKVLSNCDSYATQYPVNLFINGEYVGVYSIGEKIEEGDGRAFIREKSYSVDTGFILELNGSSDEEDENSTFGVPYLGPVTVHYPKLTLLSDKQLTFISNHMTLASRSVVQKRGWQEYIDIDSMVDWYLMTEFSYNSDSCMRRSVFFEKDSGGKIVMGQPWDFDLAFGNSRADGSYEEWAALVNSNYVKTNWMTYLMQDEDFYNALKTRWNEKKDELLETALNAVDEGERIVTPSAKYNFEKWDILFMQLSMEPYYEYEDNHTYKDHVTYLRNFINTRWSWIDKTLNSESEVVK